MIFSIIYREMNCQKKLEDMENHILSSMVRISFHALNNFKVKKLILLLFYLLDELYNDLIDMRDVFLEQNEVLGNQMKYVNQQLDQNDD